MKIAPLIRAIDKYNNTLSSSLPAISTLLIHTGQHYDVNMSESFFKDLNLPEPDVNLGIGSGSHGEQTGRVLIEFEKVLFKEQPDLVIVVGDVNSTIACTLACAKLHIPVAHVEAGLRSFDRSMPEEINRILTDAVSDYLFTPSPDGDENLLKEGIPQEKIYMVGDIMVDSLLFNLEKARKSLILKKLGLQKELSTDHCQLTTDYCLLTLHRPSNVDNKESFSRILQGLREVNSRIPIIFPIHPRTTKQIYKFGMESAFNFHELPDMNPEDYNDDKIHCFEPFGYLDFLNLMAHAKVVMTDSGGIQEETTVLDIPCITLRDTTERPITIREGTNVLVHNDPHKIKAEFSKALEGNSKKGKCPDIWDGHTAERIVKILTRSLK
jgi:UDP-N-acetylglucosamine 2-epimerase (non-hydrolysing)